MSGNNMDLTVALSVGGNAEVKRALNDLGRSVGDLGKKIEESGHSGEGLKEAFEPLAELVTRLGPLAGGAAGEISELGSALAKLGSGTVGITAAIAGAAAALSGLAAHGAEAAAAVKEGAIRVGTTTDNYTALSFAFRQSGSSAESFERAMGKILEAQGKATASAEDYEADAKRVQQSDERSAKSAEKLADARKRIGENLYETLRSSGLRYSEELRKLRIESDKAYYAVQAGDYRAHEKVTEDFLERRAELNRTTAIREAEERRKARIEENRLLQEHYREQLRLVAKHNQEIAEAADKALRGGDTGKFGKLGVDLFDTAGKARDTAEVFKDIADKIAAIENPADRSAKAVELFGRRIGTNLVEVLSKGSAGIDELAEESKKLGLMFSGDQIKVGKEFEESLDKLRSSVSATLGKIGLAFAPLLTELSESLAKAMGRGQDALVHGAERIAAFLKPMFEDLANAIDGDMEKVHSAFIRYGVEGLEVFGKALKVVYDLAAQIGKGIGIVYGTIAEALHHAFGVEVTGGDIAAFLIALKLIPPVLSLVGKAFGLLSLAGGPWLLALKLIIIAITALLPAIQGNMPQIVAAFQQAATTISALWNSTADGLKSAFNSVAQKVGDVVNFIKDWWDAGVKAVNDGFQSMYDTGKEIIEGIIAFFQKLIDTVKAVASAIGGALGGMGGGSTAQPFATGGPVSGPGGVDRVPARLTAGEFVMNTGAVSKYGVGFMHAINAQRFATGGLVQRLGEFMTPAPMHFAAGGPVPAAAGGTPIHLHMPGGHSFELSADHHVAGALVRYAAGKQMSSGGTKPSWYAGTPGG